MADLTANDSAGLDRVAAARRSRNRCRRIGCGNAHSSHALDAGGPISLVRDTLRHASIATTSIYLHSKPKDGSGKYLRL
jgi:integrase/recombinase XerD